MLEPVRYPTAISALVLGSAAAWLLWMRPNDRVHRAAALFVLNWALFLTAAAFQDSFDELAARLFPYPAIALPFSALNLGIVIAARHASPDSTWRNPLVPRIARIMVLMGLVAFAGLYLVRHDLFWRVDDVGPLYLFVPFIDIVTAAAAFAFLMMAWRARTPMRRRSLLAVSMAFLTDPLYRTTLFVLDLLANGLLPGTIGLVESGFNVIAWLIAVATVVLAVIDLRGEHVTDDKALVVGLAMAAMMSGVLMSMLDGVVAFQTWFGLFATLGAFWRIVAMGLLVYAVVQYELLTAERRAKWVVSSSTVAGLIAGGFFVISESLEQLLPTGPGVPALLGAAVIALALFPIVHLSRRMADRIFPGVDASRRYDQKRRAQLYSAAVEGALIDASVSPRERDVLLALRHELALDADVAAQLELAALARMGATHPASTSGPVSPKDQKMDAFDYQ